MTQHARRKALLAEFLESVWSNGRVDAADDYLAESYTIHHDPGDPWAGQQLNLEHYKERVRLSRAPFPDQRFTVQEMFADGDAVVVTWLWSATHTGDYPGFPASGQRISTSGATVYYFDAQDRLSGHWQITDRLGVFQQLTRGASRRQP
jgi:steroid delta-isomerase-like uncharacterized protein